MTALPTGRIKQRPEDFVVDEIPAYAPSGSGEHLFVRITKRDLTTEDAARALADALGCDRRGTGFAGMKDRRAVASQTISLHVPHGIAAEDLARRALGLKLDGVAVHDARPHGHKLKPGHLAGNRFAITVRALPRLSIDGVTRALARVGREGVPNAFGRQRFGVAGDNAARALAWLTGDARGPRDPRKRRFLWSSLQSAVFNRVLEERVADGTWSTPLAGDVLKLRSSGGLFVCTAVQTERERAERGEVSPTGPIVGARMLWPEGAPGELERRIARDTLGNDFDMTRTRHLGEGSRRPLRIWVDELRWELDGEGDGHAATSIRVYFVLPKGGYATTVLAAAVAIEETGDPAPASGNEIEDEAMEGRSEAK